MGGTSFEIVIVIGYGKIAGNVLQCLHRYSEIYGYQLAYIEHEVYPFNQAKKYALEQGLFYQKIEKDEELLSYFLHVARNKILIVSASNNYLFPLRLLEKDNVTVINFHNALLPKYPGRNAPSWVIYDDEKVTGITWHYVTEHVDAGNIIIQKKCEITWDAKAYELVMLLMDLAYEAFQECIGGVLQDTIPVIKQEVLEGRKIYRAKEVPGNGQFSLDDSPSEIYRLLRAMDYGKNTIFPLPITEVEGKLVEIKRYKLSRKNERNNLVNRCFIPFDETRELMLQYDIVKR